MKKLINDFPLMEKSFSRSNREMANEVLTNSKQSKL